MTRQQICQLTSRKLISDLPRLAGLKAALGLDGFVDEIISVVDRRHDSQHFDEIRTIAQLAERIATATGRSCNCELVVKRTKMGGNGPIMANALATIGLPVTCIGNLGYPTIHPVFEELARRARVISVGEPAHTDALEFEDGKVMLGKLAPLHQVTWDSLIERVGATELREILGDSRLIGMVNWTMLPHMTRIWARLLNEIIPNSERHSRVLFVDLADPEKRSQDDILEALKLLSRFQDQVDVVLGLNLKESVEIADVLGLPGVADPENAIEANARAIRQALNVACVVIHPRRGAAAATEDQSATFAGPFVRQPAISTGAGDHFNAGFCLGHVLGFSLEESLCAGSALSGYYVRSGESPDAPQLAEFIAQLPPPQA